MYETSVLFDPSRREPRAKTGVRRSPGKVRIRPSKQLDGTDCRRSPRLDFTTSKRRRRGALEEDPANALRKQPPRLDRPAKTERRDRLRNMSNETRKLPLGRPVRSSLGVERENGVAGGGEALDERSK